MSGESATSTIREEGQDENHEDELEEEEETELATVDMEAEPSHNVEEAIDNSDMYCSLEEANRARIEAHPHTFVGRNEYSEEGLMLWNFLQKNIEKIERGIETRVPINIFQALLKIVQYTEEIKRNADVIFDNVASIGEFQEDDWVQELFKYSKNNYQCQADRLCTFYRKPKSNILGSLNETEDEEGDGKVEEDLEKGIDETISQEIRLFEEEEEEENEKVKEEENDEENELMHPDQAGSFTQMMGQNNIPSSSTSSTPVVLNNPSNMDDLITTQSPSLPPPPSALIAALTSPSLPHLPSNDSSPLSLHNSRPPSNSIPTVSLSPQLIIAATSPQPHSPSNHSSPSPNIHHSPSNSMTVPSTPLDTHANPSRMDSSTIPPSSMVAPSSRLSSSLDGSPPLKRIRVENSSTDPVPSTSSTQSRPVQIQMSSDAKTSTPASHSLPNTPATSRLPQSMPIPNDYAQKAAWFQQMMMSQGMSQFPAMSSHQMMNFHPGMMMQGRIPVPRPTGHQVSGQVPSSMAGVPNQMPQQPGPSTPRQPNSAQSAPRPSTGSQPTSSPIQKQMQNEMIQRLMCGQNPGSPMMSPPPQVNGGHQGRQMMMMPNGQQLSMQQMQQFQQQQYYQAMMAQQMQFMQQNRPQ